MAERGGTRPAVRASLDALDADWTFERSAPSPGARLRRARAWARRRPAPDRRVLKPVTPAPRWNCLFLFMPDGRPDDDQRRMLERLRACAGRLLVVFATPTPDAAVPPALEAADALIWKAMPGFDFSAYAVALAAIAECSPGATAYLQNDSVLGPFGDLDAAVERARWDLTGFTASSAVENHLNSYAFALRRVTSERLATLAPALSTRWRCDGFDDVVLWQETRLARVAARGMSVGALWRLRGPAPRGPLRGPGGTGPALDLRADPTLSFPLSLLDRGFPFLKRSLFTKFAGLEDEAALVARLRSLGWR